MALYDLRWTLEQQAECLRIAEELDRASRGMRAHPEQSVAEAFKLAPYEVRKAVLTSLAAGLQEKIEAGKRALLVQMEAEPKRSKRKQ